MGAKTAVLVFADADVPTALREATNLPDRERTEALVRRAHPGYVLDPVDNHWLDGAVYPADDDTTYATSIGGVDVLCSRRLWFDHPSRLPEHLLELAAGRQNQTRVGDLRACRDWSMPYASQIGPQSETARSSSDGSARSARRPSVS